MSTQVHRWQPGHTRRGAAAVTATEATPRVPRWPVLLIALPAFVAIWSGWVGLGRLTGFGPVVLLPGIADHWVIDSAITLPIGVESYAAYAMFVWLAPVSVRASAEARQFACWSSIGALVLGMAGQVAYHLMTAAGMTVAPWQITAFVACLPVAVLGAAAALVHLTHRTGVELDKVDESDVEERPVADVEKVDEHGLSLYWKSAPPAAPKPAITPAPARARVSDELDDRARELIGQGFGKVRLQRELGVTEHRAKQLIKAHGPNGQVFAS